MTFRHNALFLSCSLFAPHPGHALDVRADLATVVVEVLVLVEQSVSEELSVLALGELPDDSVLFEISHMHPKAKTRLQASCRRSLSTEGRRSSLDEILDEVLSNS